MFLELQDRARRLEQQIAVFEKLHADELKRFQEQFETFRRLQSDELQMLRDELHRLRDEIALLQARETDKSQEATAKELPTGRAELTLTRRDLITGNIRPIHSRRA